MRDGPPDDQSREVPAEPPVTGPAGDAEAGRLIRARRLTAVAVVCTAVFAAAALFWSPCGAWELWTNLTQPGLLAALGGKQAFGGQLLVAGALLASTGSSVAALVAGMRGRDRGTLVAAGVSLVVVAPVFAAAVARGPCVIDLIL